MSKMDYAGTVRALIQTGHIDQFGKIWQFCPMKALAENTPIPLARLQEIKRKPTVLKKLEIRSIAKYLNVSQETVQQLVDAEKEMPRKSPGQEL